MTTRTIEVTLNGERRRVSAAATVEDLLGELGIQPGLVVVERNREILPRSDYAQTPVDEGDVLELVHFVGGG